MKVERRSETDLLVVKLIPTEECSSADLKAYAMEFEQEVYGEKVVVVACNDEFREIYEATAY